MFHDARIISTMAETRCVHQTEQQTELGIMIFLDHATHVKFDIGQFYQLSCVANQSKHLPIGHDTIDMLGTVEIVEHGGMRRFLSALAFYTLIKRTFIQCVQFDITSFITYNDDRHLSKFGTDIGNIKLTLAYL